MRVPNNRWLGKNPIYKCMMVRGYPHDSETSILKSEATQSQEGLHQQLLKQQRMRVDKQMWVDRLVNGF